MLNKPSDTNFIQGQFQNLNVLLLKAIESLSNVADPNVSVALQDLKNIADSIGRLQGGVTGRLQTGKHKLRTLVEVGHVINSSLGLDRVLEQVMDSLIALVQAERGFLVLRDETGEPQVRIARGIDQVDLEEEAFAYSRTIVHRVMSSGQPVLTTNAQDDPRFGMQASIVSLQLRSILCVPMKLKDEIIGVMFVDNRAHIGFFKGSDLELLSAFADQAAMAINNAQLFDRLQAANRDLEAANTELERAYEATLRGWVRALDLRDKETEGHTQRVTSLTQELARKMGVDEGQIVHIKRGALLHDIGKMGIPDGILLKPGSLTPEERKHMKRHPSLAYEMLNPIEFLEPATEIPYCHHEKWDGSGYPRRLRGEEIPFAARIFSIVDVWDALTSQRPYRGPMDPDEVREIIREESGKHFDPQVVEAFLGMKDLPVSQPPVDIQ
ncbi:MAG: HD domain-containing phosphohydrolase [Anaerolineales bacterium]|jgi:putative nucleotidyltransferase with HDIG domain